MPDIFSAYDNRELSWLKFNKRVLEEAIDESTPLMERFLFESIFSCNLDEFFMVRTGTLIRRMLDDDSKTDNKTLLRPSEQLLRIYANVRELISIKDEIHAKIENELSHKGIRRLSYDRLNERQREFADDLFDSSIKPFLNVYHISHGDIFPFLENKKIYTAVRYETSNVHSEAVISDNSAVDDLIILPSQDDKTEYILKEDLIYASSSRILENKNIIEKVMIRATRSAALTLDDEPVTDTDRLEAMTMVLAKRKIMPVLRLQFSCEISQLFRDTLTTAAEVSGDRVFIERTPLEMSYVSKLHKMLKAREHLYFESYTPVYPEMIDEKTPVFDQAIKNDLIISYPYESMSPFIRMLDEAAVDERVTDIKITVYRVADDSKIISALCKASENGKNVTVCIELRARFDEQHNILCAEKLKASGCKVIYGIKGIKVHSKLCLIKRNINNEPICITQIGTGNYNEKTSLQYTDFSLITADTDIAEDAERLFEELEQGRTTNECTALLVAPTILRNRILTMLDNEIRHALNGEKAYFGAKMNGLTDKAIIDKLIEASKAGVKIDLIVRGVCCIISGIKGLTENIRVISIVGRYLEHGRIYIFGCGERRKVYISSADLMTRNTCRRIEAAAPINDEKIKKRIIDYFETQLSDNVKARIQRSDGTYSVHPDHNNSRINSQNIFMGKIIQPEKNENKETVSSEITNLNNVEESMETPVEQNNNNEKRPGLFRRIIMFFTRKKK